MLLIVSVFTSCGNSATVTPGEEIPSADSATMTPGEETTPYGIEDRFIGCWIEKVEEGENKRVMQFLPNGKVYSRTDGVDEDLFLDRGYLDSGVWYTSEENILTLDDVGNFRFAELTYTTCLVKYAFIDDNTFTVSAGGSTYTFVRTTELFADIAF